VVDVIALQFLLELSGAPPAGVLPPVVGEHFLRRAVRRHRLAVGLHHVGAGLAAVHSQSSDVPGVVIEEPDDVRHLPQDGEVGDVALPHLVRRGTLEPPLRGLRLLARLPLGRCQPRRLQVLAHGLRTGFEEEQPPQDLRNPLRSLPRVFLFQLRDLRTDHRQRAVHGSRPASAFRLQPCFPFLPVLSHPVEDRAVPQAKLRRDQRRRYAFLQVQPNCLAL
jgi:hypothetical protein